MRRRFSYANVTATLALVFAMAGGAIAARHYLISSTRQISPRVLRELRGRAGATGRAGAQGAQGREGKEGREGREGKEGKPGIVPATLPSGHSESGMYSVAGSEGGYITQGITFPVPLASALGEAHVAWLKAGAPTASCPGVGSAAQGYLCVYEESGAFDKPDVLINPVSTHLGHAGADSYGFMIFLDVEGGERLAYSYGSWTVTAP
jgi:hypothetical protein